MIVLTNENEITEEEQELKTHFESIDIGALFEELKNEQIEAAQEDTTTGAVYKDTITSARRAMVGSQKAGDILNVCESYKAGKGQWRPLFTEFFLIDDEYEVIKNAFDRVEEHCEKREDGKMVAFLRACPLKPRHGVLESIKVTADTIQDTWIHLRNVMREQDPEGCMILQPFVHATSSCVLAPQQYAAVGDGHDGITAGHGYKLYFHLNPDDSILSEHIENTVGKKVGGYELEFVYKRGENFKRLKKAGGSSYITQVRGAPPHPVREAPFSYELDGKMLTASTDGMIPNGSVECKEVWVASGLESVAYLEEHITKEQCPEGYVISEPNGSLLSHICAHARTHGIPYVVGNVEMGQRWTEGSATWVALDPYNNIEPQPYNPCTEGLIEAFTAGLERSKTHWQRQHGWFAHFFHQWAGMNYNGKDGAFLAGGFCGWMAKAILALSLGELRYSKSLKKNMTIEGWPVLTAMMGGDKWEELTQSKKASTSDRKHYYALCEQMNVDYNEIRLALQWCVKQFNSGWSGGYGGKAWANCAERGVALCTAIVEFKNSPCEETLNALIGAVNSAKNAEHNNGFLYGKFLSQSAFNYSDIKKDATNSTYIGLFPHTETGITRMFRTYELAKEFRGGPVNKNCSAPSTDWMTLFSFLKGKGHTYWRQYFIANSLEIPRGLREAAIDCGPNYLHHDNKYSHEENFIPCGIDECEKCKQYDVVVMQLKYGTNVSSMLLTGEYPEAFPAQGKESSTAMTYATAQLLRDREYDKVTPEMWMSAIDGLNPLDQTYPILADILTKFAKNQMGDDYEWVDAVLVKLGGEN